MELVPEQVSDYFLEIGCAWQLPAEMNRLTWLGQGPFNAYPGQMESGIIGMYTIYPQGRFHPADRYYDGNRVHVWLSALGDDRRNELFYLSNDAAISLEKENNRMVFTHLLKIAGKGNKLLFLPLLPTPGGFHS